MKSRVNAAVRRPTDAGFDWTLDSDDQLTCLVVGEVQDLYAVWVGDVCGLGLGVEVDLSAEQSVLEGHRRKDAVKLSETGSMAVWVHRQHICVRVSDLTTRWSVISLVSPLKKVTLTVCPSADTSFLVPLGKTMRRSPLVRTFSV